jgi:queuine tRNA-ribosyltransferase
MRHLLRGKVLLGARLAIIHNTHYIQTLMRDLRAAIAEKRLQEFVENWYAQRQMPVPGS